jgi:hypothetical protein
VTSELNIGPGAFNNLPANLPVFGRADVLIPTDGGGGFPQNNYQTINKVDLSINNRTQANVIFALQRVDSFVGTQSQSPYPQYNSGTNERKYNINGSVTRVWSNSFTSQSKLVWNKLSENQPVDRPGEPRLFMNTGGPVRIDNYRIAFPGYLPFSPGADLPAFGPQKLTQFYQDQTWLKGAHDIRFGGTYIHIADDHSFGAYQNAVEGLSSSNNPTLSLNNLTLGQIARFQRAINPNGYPGGTFVTPVGFPDFLSKNRYSEYALYANDNWSIGDRLKLNLGMRYEYFGPQTKSEPKYDSNFYWGDPNLNLNEATTLEVLASVRTGSIQPTNTSPIGGLWNPDRNNFAPRLGFAWDVFGDGRTAVRGGYGIAYERNFGNVTYNVTFNPPLYLVTQIDAVDVGGTLPIFTDPAGPFGGVAGVTKPIPVGSPRHVDQNIKTAYSHIYGVSITKDMSGLLTGSIEYNGSTGRNLYDLADVNKAGAPLVYEGVGTQFGRANTQYTAFNTRGNRGRSQYHAVVFSADSRQFGNTGLATTAKYTLSHAKDNLSETFSLGDNNGYFNLGYLDAFDPMLDYGNAGFDVRHRFSASAIWAVPFGGTNPWLGGWQVNALFTARGGYPFSIFDCTNAVVAVCMRALDPAGIERQTNTSIATGSPNEYDLLDISALAPFAGTYVHPVQGTSEFGPYPDTMTKRNDFRGPGAWNMDFIIGKRFRFGNKAALIRLEAYNVFNHANLYAQTDAADVSAVTSITGFKDDFRRMQLGLKFEF